MEPLVSFFRKTPFLIFYLGISIMASEPQIKRNHGILATGFPNQETISQELVDYYWSKRLTELTINQVTFDQCPEIEVVVSLLDDQGNPISGLTDEDFTLTEDGAPLPINVRPISSGAGSELSIAICIDISGSLSGSDLQNEKDAAIQLVNLLGDGDSVAVYSFGSGVNLILDFTDDKAAAINAIASITGSGATALFDAVSTALANTDNQSGRKAVVVMTDGADNNSSVSLEQVIDQAVDANIPLFPIGFGNAFAPVLEAMANQTGGLFFPSATSGDLLTILDQIGTILGQQYIISYRTPSPDGLSHAIAIESVIGGETVGDTRDYSGCLNQPTPEPPVFIDSGNFTLDENGNLICIYPDPNSDGSNVDGLDDLGYMVSIWVDCQIVHGPVPVFQNDAQDPWPKVLTLDSNMVPDQPYQIRVSRAYGGQTAADVSYTEIQGPQSTQSTIPTNARSYERWLLHIPRVVSGFQATLRIDNIYPLDSEVSLAGFDENGNLLRVEQLNVAGRDKVYVEIYGSGLFQEHQDLISHIGIFESFPLTEVWLQYRHTTSGFGSWVQEVDLAEGNTSATALEVEGRSDTRYEDGVALLNLAATQSAQPWVVQVSKTNGTTLAEVQLNPVPPGGKIRVVLSNLFPFQNDTVYRLETRNSQTIQAMGLSFFGSDFFAPIPVIGP